MGPPFIVRKATAQLSLSGTSGGSGGGNSVSSRAGRVVVVVVGPALMWAHRFERIRTSLPLSEALRGKRVIE